MRFGRNFATGIGFAGLLIHASAASSTTPEQFSLAQASEAMAESRTMQGVVSSPRGRYVAWIDQGSLRVAREPTFEPRTLVVAGGTDAITRVYPSSDGRALFYVRGASRSAFGSIPATDTRALWQVEVGDGAVPEPVASGADVPSDLVFAPDGKAFAFCESNVLYEFRRHVNGGWKRNQLLQAEARHAAATRLYGIRYSPEGSQIAFVSERKAGQSYIAIHDVAKGTTRYVEPGIFKDGSPVWSPDGRELAFVRTPGNWTMNYRFSPRLEGVPWSLLVVDVSSGTVRTLWKADGGPGSVPVTFDPIWTSDDRILFSWEKTGWNLMYAVPARGGQAVLLTPGEGETGNPVLSPDARTLVYEANIGDLPRRHLWSLDLHGSRPMLLTPGNGVERRPQFTAGGYLVYGADYGDSRAPELQIRSPSGEVRAITLGSTDAETWRRTLWKQFRRADVVSVRAEDGITSHHVVIQPGTRPPAGGYPVVVNAHGGPASQTLPGGGRFAFGQYLASRGYLFVDMNYRGSTGFGLDYRLPEGRGATGGSEVKDLAALAQYLRNRGDVNPKRIGIMGHSYGGHMVGLAMSRLPESYAAGASLFGVADWVVEMKKDQEDEAWMSAPPEYIRLSERLRIEDLAYESSPATHLQHWRGPTLLTIGDLDRSGHVESVIDLGVQLLSRGIPVEFYIDPAGAHNVYAEPQVVDFFERNLK